MKKSEEILYAKSFVDALSQGQNPLTGEKLNDNDVMKNERMVKCMLYVSNLLKESAEKEKKNEEKIVSQNYYVNFSTIVYTLRDKYPEHAFFLGRASIFYWMVVNGYGQYTCDEYGHRRKVATKLGNEIGMINRPTKIKGIIFDKNAQELIYSKVEEIAQLGKDRYKKIMQHKIKEHTDEE